MRLGGPDYNGSRPRFRLCHGFLYNLCTTVSSCFYVFCCCWLLEDCFGSNRSLPWPPYESPEPPPPPPRHTHFGPLFGSPEPPPPPYHHTHVGPGPQGFLASGFGPPGPPPPPGPYGYPGEPAPF
ncbi:hypothetical protein ABFS82_07G020100 [Erythranthe guttata]